MSGLFSWDAWSTVWNHRESFLLGLGNTLQTAVCALALAFAIGAALGLMATSGNKVLKLIARVYVEFIQNTPLLLQLCFLYYALAFAGLSLGVIRTGIIALGVYTGAYMGEVVRATIESVPKGQFEAAQAQGFNYLQRMAYIILPQSIPVMLPPDGQPGGQPLQEHLLPVHRGRCRPHQCDVQLRHGCIHRWCLCPGLHHLLVDLLRGLLPAVHAGHPLGSIAQGTQGPRRPRAAHRSPRGTEGGGLIWKRWHPVSPS